MFPQTIWYIRWSLFFRWFVLWSCFTSTQPTDKSCRLSPCADYVSEAHLCLFVAKTVGPTPYAYPATISCNCFEPWNTEDMRSIGLRFYARWRIAVVITRCLKAWQTCNCIQTGAAPKHNLICSNVYGWTNLSCFFHAVSWQTTKVGQLMSVLWRHYVAFSKCIYLRFIFWIIWTIFTNLFERNASRVHSKAVLFF